MSSDIVQRLIVFFGPLLFALCFHEYAHGWVAKLRGDDTAERQGRLSMNPMVHADLYGTVIFPILTILLSSPISFGWAKPVPVNARNLKNPRVDMFWIALAGPLSNVLLAVVTTVLMALIVHLNLLPSLQTGLRSFGETFIVLNLYLAVFNAIPLHPLDGGKILARFLPARLNYKLEQNEQISSLILMVLIFSGATYILRYPVILIASFLLSFVY